MILRVTDLVDNKVVQSYSMGGDLHISSGENEFYFDTNCGNEVIQRCYGVIRGGYGVI
jgi:predicted RNA-binding Zn-ribbon protein involved in translation (DUF1610 family)